MSELTQAQFNLIAKLIQSKEPARTAARIVLVEGQGNQQAIATTGLSPQSVSNTLGRYRRTHQSILNVYLKPPLHTLERSNQPNSQQPKTAQTA